MAKNKQCLNCGTAIDNRSIRCRSCTRKNTRINKPCERCGIIFTVQKGEGFCVKIYCGNRSKKMGCAWIVRQEYLQEFRPTQYRTDKTRTAQREWKRIQRTNKTPYYFRQLALNKNNHKRRLKSDIVGSHTWIEWENLKSAHNHKCVICGKSENEIKIIWAGTEFTHLTEDHIIPISKGGTNFITNIQPACISCNSSKGNKIQVKVQDA